MSTTPWKDLKRELSPINATTSKRIRSWGRINPDQIRPRLGGGSGHTHTDIDKNALYAKNGDTELWRYDGRPQNLSTPDGEVSEVANSPIFPGQQEVFYRFLEQCKTQGEAQANRKFRIWVQENQAQTLAPAQTPSPYSFK